VRRARRPQPAGFTLVEVLCAIALMLILTTLSVSALTLTRQRVALQEGAELLQQVLLSARQKARATGRCVRVELLDGSGQPSASPPTAAAKSLRVRAWTSPHCEPGAADSLDEGGERYPVPHGLAVVRVSPADPLAADWLPSGRTRDGARMLFRVAYADSSFAVVAAPQGPVCVHHQDDEACP
jgi:prepilin-type N-terminal cleavage/methylation domain-containing protein